MRLSAAADSRPGLQSKKRTAIEAGGAAGVIDRNNNCRAATARRYKMVS